MFKYLYQMLLLGILPLRLDDGGDGGGGDGGVDPPSGPLADAEGNLREGWTDNEALAAKYTTVEGLAKGYLNAQQMIGVEKMPIPSEDSPQDVWDLVHSKIGWPENVDDYTLEKPEDLPEGIPWDDGEAKEFLNLAHELRLTQKQIEGLSKFDIGRMVKGQEAMQRGLDQAQEAASTQLNEAWGKDYNKNLELAQAAADLIDPELMEDQSLGNNPKFLQALAKVGSMMSEGKLKAGRQMHTPLVDVDSEIAQMRDKESGHPFARAFNNSGDPDHLKAVTHMEKLYKLKYPDSND